MDNLYKTISQINDVVRDKGITSYIYMIVPKTSRMEGFGSLKTLDIKIYKMQRKEHIVVHTATFKGVDEAELFNKAATETLKYFIDNGV